MKAYITKHSEAMVSHSICLDCYEKYAKKQLKNYIQKKRKNKKRFKPGFSI